MSGELSENSICTNFDIISLTPFLHFGQYAESHYLENIKDHFQTVPIDWWIPFQVWPILLSMSSTIRLLRAAFVYVWTSLTLQKAFLALTTHLKPYQHTYLRTSAQQYISNQHHPSRFRSVKGSHPYTFSLSRWQQSPTHIAQHDFFGISSTSNLLLPCYTAHKLVFDSLKAWLNSWKSPFIAHR